jgi:O-antigen/teichoic acid export membrane protein
MAGDMAVGLYTAANRIVRVIISIVTSIAAVTVPRLENALNKGDVSTYRNYCNKSLRFILIFGAPCCLGLIALAPEIIWLFAGEKYFGSILSLRLLAPIIVIVGLANFTGLQILYANRKEKYYTIAVSAAAVINAVFNFCMIPVLHQNGAIIGTVLAELIGLGMQMVFARKLLKDTELFSWNTVKYGIAAAVMAAMVFFVRTRIDSLVLTVIISLGTGALSYTIMLILLREKTCMSVFQNLKN